MRYTRFEKARIIGARALQISMGSPILIDVPSGVVDPIEIAWIESGRPDASRARPPSTVPKAIDCVLRMNRRFYIELYTHN